MISFYYLFLFALINHFAGINSASINIKGRSVIMGSVGDAMVGEKKPTVVFVLGGAGCGKSTQCSRIAQMMGYTHLSSGDLRAEAKKHTDEGNMIRRKLKDGVIFPSEIILKFLIKAMRESGNDKFLLDGFPRSEENRSAFEAFTQIKSDLVLFFECSEEERQKRILDRKQARDDDNIESIKKRFNGFQETTMPVIQYYESRGKVIKIDAERGMEEVFEQVKDALMPDGGADFTCRHN